MNEKQKTLWLTDTHLLPWRRRKMLNVINDQHPSSIFLTGDVSSCASLFLGDLAFLGPRIGAPLYFVSGNHDYWGSSFEKVEDGIRNLCAKHKFLIWMSDAGIVELNEEVALIGQEGFYDALVGDERFITATFDWWMIENFRKLPSMGARLEAMRELAKQSAHKLSTLLEEAVSQYKTVICLTHYPPFKCANRASGIPWIEKFWEPYNVNSQLGEALEAVMINHKKRNLLVLSGHCHSPMTARVSRNIECRVGRGSYTHLSEQEIIYI
jgi:3',5'-cyclic-AMP phosphodiesterase